MKIIPFVHDGLGNSSYLVDRGDSRALLVDPDRSVDRYLAAADELGLAIDAVVETHLHADFISGGREVADRLGARVFLPAGAEARFDHVPVDEDAPIELDGMRVEAVYTPGHTPEHLSYLVHLGQTSPVLFSGGSLIVGGAARTDLLDPSLTEQLTRHQYRSIRDRLAPLPDETGLYPTHGAGSFCSTGAGGERTSTLGAERRTNPVFTFDTEDEFVEWFPATFPGAPAYFFKLRTVNQAGPRLLRDVPMPRQLAPEELAEARQGATVVDVRPVHAYLNGHIAGSLANAFRASFATWLGWLLPLDTPLIFVTGDQPIEPIIDEAMLVGFEHFAGWLGGTPEDWHGAGVEVTSQPGVGAPAARAMLADGAVPLDVREPDEYAQGHLPGAIHAPLGDLAARAESLPRDRPVVVYCGQGERATTAVSLLESLGFEALANLDGGIGAWTRERYEVSRE